MKWLIDEFCLKDKSLKNVLVCDYLQTKTLSFLINSYKRHVATYDQIYEKIKHFYLLKQWTNLLTRGNFSDGSNVTQKSFDVEGWDYILIGFRSSRWDSRVPKMRISADCKDDVWCTNEVERCFAPIHEAGCADLEPDWIDSTGRSCNSYSGIETFACIIIIIIIIILFLWDRGRCKFAS